MQTMSLALQLCVSIIARLTPPGPRLAHLCSPSRAQFYALHIKLVELNSAIDMISARKDPDMCTSSKCHDSSLALPKHTKTPGEQAWLLCLQCRPWSNPQRWAPG